MKLDEVARYLSEFLFEDKTGLNIDVPTNEWVFVEVYMKSLDGRVSIDSVFINGKQA